MLGNNYVHMYMSYAGDKRKNNYMYGCVIDDQTACRDHHYKLLLKLLIAGK